MLAHDSPAQKWESTPIQPDHRHPKGIIAHFFGFRKGDFVEWAFSDAFLRRACFCAPRGIFVFFIEALRTEQKTAGLSALARRESEWVGKYPTNRAATPIWQMLRARGVGSHR